MRSVIPGGGVLRVGLLLVPLSLAACGGAQSPAGASPPAAEPVFAPTTIEEAEAQIREAEAALGRGEAPEVATAGAATSRAAADDAVAAEPKDRRDPCRTSCRALASMTRAVEALCRMTSDADARCAKGRATLAESQARAASCGC